MSSMCSSIMPENAFEPLVGLRKWPNKDVERKTFGFVFSHGEFSNISKNV